MSSSYSLIAFPINPIVDLLSSRKTYRSGSKKAELLKLIAFKEDIHLEQVIAVGDGSNDLPMLRLAGLGIAFHAKPKVKASAKHAISTIGLDAILYLLGFRDREINM